MSDDKKTIDGLWDMVRGLREEIISDLRAWLDNYLREWMKAGTSLLTKRVELLEQVQMTPPPAPSPEKTAEEAFEEYWERNLARVICYRKREHRETFLAGRRSVSKENK